MKNKLSIKIAVAVIASGIAIASLAGCSATNASPTPIAKATHAASTPSPKTSAAESAAKTAHSEVTTAAGTFVACSIWVPNGTTTQSTVYMNGSTCVLLIENSVYVKLIGKDLQCASDLSTGNSAVGAVISGKTYKCVTEIPAAGK
jgi:threonine/homoserine efflux transporter RhtA